MHTSGTVIVVQEHRFELLGEDGARRHFTLAHDAPLGWHELVELQRERQTVRLRHDAQPHGHTTAAVHAVERVEPGERLARQSPEPMGSRS
jgi:hypothetical protein